MSVPVFWMTDPEADAIKSPFVRQPRYNDLENRVDQLKAQLWKYGKHLSTCALWENMAKGCNCGWVEVRSTLAPAKQSSADAFNASMAPFASDAGEKHGR